jgi:hypothetical protein
MTAGRLGGPMAADRPAVRPPDTLKVRGRLRAAWLALWLAGAAGCVAVGLYGDTPEDTLGSHQIFLSLFLFLAAVSVVVAVRGFGRGLDADGNGVVVRHMLRAISIPWRELAAHRVQRGGLSGHQRHVLPAGPSSGMTDLGSGPRHPAVEQDPASTSLNSGNVCSPCDTPQLGHSSTQRRDSRPPPFSCRAMPQLRWTPSRGPFATRFLGSGNPPLCQVMSAASSSRPTGPATTWSRFTRSLIRLHRGWLLRGSRPLPADGG